MKVYAGIGSRQTPRNILEVMQTVAGNLADLGWTLRSGHADGADWAFECGAVEANGETEIFIPWRGFNAQLKTKADLYILNHNEEVEALAAANHPNWGACTQGAKKLHMRNMCQILGHDLKSPVDMVICWTPRAAGGGGTGQAIRLAKSRGIPVFDLADPDDWDNLNKFLGL